MKFSRKYSVFNFVIVLLSLCINASGINAQTSQNDQSQSAQFGPLLVTPKSATVTLKKNNDDTVLRPVLRFMVKNTSPADVKVIIFGWSVVALDDRGESLFSKGLDVLTGGIPMSRESKDNFNRAFNDKSQFVIMSPNQTVELQMFPNDWPRTINDKDNAFYKTFRPTTYSINASLGIVLVDNTTEIRAFSFSDLPLKTIVQ
jgi:hypothetical protein